MATLVWESGVPDEAGVKAATQDPWQGAADSRLGPGQS
jgi:hypothetical protein